jgi:hypothetical protein
MASAEDGSSYFGADLGVSVQKLTGDDGFFGDGINVLAGDAMANKSTLRKRLSPKFSRWKFAQGGAARRRGTENDSGEESCMSWMVARIWWPARRLGEAPYRV